MENCGEQLMAVAPKPLARNTDHKGNMTHFDIFSGDTKDSSNGHKPVPVQFQAAFVMQSAPQAYGGHLELGFCQPDLVCGKYPYGDQYYGMVSTYGPQIAGRVMLPLNLGTDDGPIFVNAKQYNGIIRRRRSRAKAEMTKKVTKSRKPFQHLSRHLHAKRRPRGCGGRFLNTKELEMCKIQNLDLPAGSQRSEVLQSDHETNGSRSHMSGSEVTSMFSMGDLNHFPMGDLNHFPIGNLGISDMMMSGNDIHGFGMNNKWVAAAAGGGSHCNVAI
ncbi:nuclear transcription factor Y subunit A-10-like isoform X2 [Rutidosis leptorrhynchoides]